MLWLTAGLEGLPDLTARLEGPHGLTARLGGLLRLTARLGGPPWLTASLEATLMLTARLEVPRGLTARLEGPLVSSASSTQLNFSLFLIDQQFISSRKKLHSDQRRNLPFLLLLTLVRDPDGGLHGPPAAVPAHTTQEEVDTRLGGGLGGEG